MRSEESRHYFSGGLRGINTKKEPPAQRVTVFSIKSPLAVMTAGVPRPRILGLKKLWGYGIMMCMMLCILLDTESEAVGWNSI